MLYNIMTCIGPPGGWNIGFMGGCSIAWLVLGFLFLLLMAIKRQTDDGVLQGTSFNVLAAGIAGLGAALVLVTLFGQPKWEFLGGIVGIAAGGFGIGLITGDGGGSE